MRDVLGRLAQWTSDGKEVAIATVIRTEGSAPRAPGAVMAVSQDGEVIGSVSGGCVESAVYEEAMTVLKTRVPKLVRYGIIGDQSFEVGLTCGGTIHVFIERLDW